jgi:YVTN family beta-propeller protein
MNRATPCALLTLVFALTACVHAPATLPSSVQSAPYAVGAIYPIAGQGRWDLLAVDAPRYHLFLSRTDHVQVVDTRTGQVVSTLAGTDGVHGFAIAPSLGRGYATNGNANTVTEFDLVTLQRVRDLPVSGKSPDAALFDEVSGRVFVFNAHSNNVSVLDAATGREVSTIAFAGNPELGASDGKGHVFVNIEDKAEVDEIDSRLMRVTRTWPLVGCEEPTGLAMDVAHARLFSVCQNRTMIVTDAVTGRQVARVSIDEGPDGAVFDPQAQSVFSPNGKSGTLTVVREEDPEHFRVVQTLVTQAGARTIALDPTTHRMYLPTARFVPPSPGSKERPAIIPESFTLLMVEPGTGGGMSGK